MAPRAPGWWRETAAQPRPAREAMSLRYETGCRTPTRHQPPASSGRTERLVGTPSRAASGRKMRCRAEEGPGPTAERRPHRGDEAGTNRPDPTTLGSDRMRTRTRSARTRRQTTDVHCAPRKRICRLRRRSDGPSDLRTKVPEKPSSGRSPRSNGRSSAAGRRSWPAAVSTL